MHYKSKCSISPAECNNKLEMLFSRNTNSYNRTIPRSYLVGLPLHLLIQNHSFHHVQFQSHATGFLLTTMLLPLILSRYSGLLRVIKPDLTRARVFPGWQRGQDKLKGGSDCTSVLRPTCLVMITIKGTF